jgi:single stranded DNA-binding protein
MSLPTVTVIGNVKFMETKFTQNGKQVTSLVVSCSDKNKDGNYDNLNIKADFWGKQAEFINKYFKDGDAIIVTGKIVANTWEQNGVKRSEIKFHFPSASFVPKVQQQSNNSQANMQQQYQQPQQVQQQAPVYEYQNSQGRTVPPPQQPQQVQVDDGNFPF